MVQEESPTMGMERIKLEGQDTDGKPLISNSLEHVKSETQTEEGIQSQLLAQSGPMTHDHSDTSPDEKPTKSGSKSSQKPPKRTPPLFGDLPSATTKACAAFQVIPDCLYGSKNLGSTENDAFDCDCREEWQNGENHACGEDADCINRATKMECPTEGSCGGSCQNQRFQRKEYAQVSVIDTGKKGYGLRTDAHLHEHEFIFEYIGEVINEPTFRRRMLQYDQQGIKHFYFMSLSKSEFVDATKKGNLGRFCNHSCNPNCYVDKWVVGDKLRMGIFALRPIVAGEELVFNYNVDRYGADPQPCYCGEPNCVGFIGGKTQTGRATKLPAGIAEALGIDAGDGWDTAVAKKPRKKRADEDDEEYVNSIQPRPLDDEDAKKVMAALMQCKEKWIVVKLLERIQHCDDERAIQCVMRMHAYSILKTTLITFQDDNNIVLQILGILYKFPRLTRNKIADSKIEAAIETLTDSRHEEVAEKATRILQEWSKLEVAYRIRRRKHDPNALHTVFEDRRGGGQAREEPTPQKVSSPRAIDAPKGPRSIVPQRLNGPSFNGSRPPRRPFGSLPPGWFHAKDQSGKSYFYDKQGTTTWVRPTQPAVDQAASRARQEKQDIANIIKRVTKEDTSISRQSSHTPQQSEVPAKISKQDKWRSLSVDKQMKIYENTISSHVRHVMMKFRHKLPKDELKRLSKEISKKLVASDYKNNRVQDPATPLSDKQASKVKKYVYDFFHRAVEKFGTQAGKGPEGSEPPSQGSTTPLGFPEGKADTPATSTTPKDATASPDGGEDAMMLGADDLLSPSSAELKRKRGGEAVDSAQLTPSDGPEAKRFKDEEGDAVSSPSPPPPGPPPPPAENEEQRALREQEEALMRENEEAQRLDDEANKIERLEKEADEMQKEIDAVKSGKQEVLSH